MKQAQRAQQALVRRCLDFFGEYDLLLTPAVMVSASNMREMHRHMALQQSYA